MFTRSAVAAGVSAALLLAATFRLQADETALLIELDPREGAFPAAVSASGAVVAGGLENGGGFYWMPTTGVIFAGGVTADGVSRDGHTIVGWARDARGI